MEEKEEDAEVQESQAMADAEIPDSKAVEEKEEDAEGIEVEEVSEVKMDEPEPGEVPGGVPGTGSEDSTKPEMEAKGPAGGQSFSTRALEGLMQHQAKTMLLQQKKAAAEPTEAEAEEDKEASDVEIILSEDERADMTAKGTFKAHC